MVTSFQKLPSAALIERDGRKAAKKPVKRLPKRPVIKSGSIHCRMEQKIESKNENANESLVILQT
jgi:hypothetical protein